MNKKITLVTSWSIAVILCLLQPLSHFCVNASESYDLSSGSDDGKTADTIHVSSIEDLKNLSENCTVDSWSQDKIVVLDRDISLNNTDFSPIPTFGGIFLGQEHTISGLNLKGGSDDMGLFRYIQETGEIHDLNVSGNAAADSSHLGLGLLTGCNRGLISNCHVTGSITGGDYVGILAGSNEITGVITDCRTEGTLYGNHMAGGIAGMNKGNILNCYNNSNVNTTVSDNNVNISSLTVTDLFTTENAASVTDIGGIAGSSFGIIRACVNNGSVGYQHVGYNIGGIAGSQTGYIEGCVNYGILNGRKDVGGIAGQMEPSSEIEYAEDTLDRLNTEFNKLHSLVTKMTEDAGGASSELTSQADHLLTSVDNAQSAMDNIADQVSADMNDFSLRLTDIASLPTPKPFSLDFLDELPSPSFTPFPSRSPSATPGGTPSPTPANTPEQTPSPTPTATPAGNSAVDSPIETTSEESGNDQSKEPEQSDEQESFTLPKLWSATKAEPVRILYAPPAATPTPTATPTATPNWMERLEDGINKIPDFDKEEAEKEINKVQENVYDDASEVLDSMKNTFSNEVSLTGDRISAYHASLSSSFSAIITDMRLLNTMLDDENQVLLDDFQAITDELNVIENIITNPDTPNPDDMIDDVSDEDKETDITGKVMNCYNKGKVYGDLNVGGIAGAMSRENNLDPEDDLNFARDDSGLNIRYKERMVIRKSQNLGVIEGKKNCVGGVVGSMSLGSIIDCIGSGDVSGEGDMIGGIAGQANGVIRSSSAKCALSGDNQIGGIAGFGKTIFDCYSMVEIKEGCNYLGSVAGKAELSEDIHDNYFVEGCPPGIDGISYTGIAEPVAYHDFLNFEELPDVYQNIHLTFMADDRIVSTVTLSYGENFNVNKLPAVPKKEGYSGRWEDFNSSALTFDQTINAVYSEYITTLESIQTEGGRPAVLVEGTFETNDRFILSDIDAYPEDAKTNAVCRKISILGGTGPYTVRYLIPSDMENPKIELFENGSFIPVRGETDGSYYVFSTDKPEFIFCCVDRPDSPAARIIIIAVTALLAAIVIITIWIHKKHKKRRKEKGK